MNRLNPDTLALAVDSIRENSGIVYTHIDLIANDFGQAKLLSIGEGDIVNIAMSWIWELENRIISFSFGFDRIWGYTNILIDEGNEPIGVVIFIN